MTRPWILATAAAMLAAPALGLSSPARADDDFKLMKAENIGGLKVGMAEAELKKIVPAQPQRGREAHRGADGLYQQKWTYAKQGLSLWMVSEKARQPKTIDSITCTAGCTLRTARGIGIGSAEADVRKAYAAELNKEESKPGVLVAGSIYGGLIVNTKGSKVTALFLGAAAE